MTRPANEANWGVPGAGPATPTENNSRNNESINANMSQHLDGAVRPTYITAGATWASDDGSSPQMIEVYFFDGTDDILVYTIDVSANTVTPAGVGTFAFANLAATPAQTLAGKMSAADQEIERPKFTDYGETLNAIGSTGGGTQDIDLELGNTVSATVDTSANTFTFSNPPATGITGSFTLTLTNGGSQTVNWPASVDWPGGTAPTLTVSGKDKFVFTTDDAGTVWDGFTAGLDIK